MRSCLVVLVLLVCLVSCGKSDNKEKTVASPTGQGPSIGDTARFISNFASANESAAERDRLEISVDDPCVITFKNKSLGWEIDFRSLNPESVKLQEDPALIQVSTTNGEKTIRCKRSMVAPAAFQISAEDLLEDLRLAECDNTVLSVIDFHALPDAEEKLPKVAEALVHLILKCGGKKDMF